MNNYRLPVGAEDCGHDTPACDLDCCVRHAERVEEKKECTCGQVYFCGAHSSPSKEVDEKCPCDDGAACVKAHIKGCKYYSAPHQPTEGNRNDSYHEIERIFNEFKNGATYSDSIEKVQNILSKSRLATLEEAKEALGKCGMRENPEIYGEHEPSVAFAQGFNEALSSAQQTLEEMKNK